jgi:hypothetical protein
MKEHFHYPSMEKAGFFTKEMKGNYEAQSKRVCDFFGFETVYEYGKDEIACHISSVKPSKDDPFITVVSSIYE